jgi:hypothetical protein
MIKTITVRLPDTRDIEIAVARHFNPRQNVIIPNISWGWGLQYEADMVVLRSSGFAIEIEIKCIKSDIKADLKKLHLHNSNKFRQLWFAVPEELANDPNIPHHAGILAICSPKLDSKNYYVKTIRAAKLNKLARKIDEKETRKLLELGCMRIWSLKEKLLNKINEHHFTN